MKSIEEINEMSSDDIKLEMLRLWHEADFNILSEEDASDLEEQLRLYRSVIRSRHYDNCMKEGVQL